MYHIIKFLDGSVEVVFDEWIDVRHDGNIVEVAFPPKNNYQSLRKYLRDGTPSHSTWATFEGQILYSNGRFIVGLFINVITKQISRVELI